MSGYQICCREVEVGIGAFKRDSSAAVAALGLESEWRDPLATPLHPWAIFSGGAHKVDTPPTCLHTDLGFDTLQTYHHRRTAVGPSSTFLFECLICCTNVKMQAPVVVMSTLNPTMKLWEAIQIARGRSLD